MHSVPLPYEVALRVSIYYSALTPRAEMPVYYMVINTTLYRMKDSQPKVDDLLYILLITVLRYFAS